MICHGPHCGQEIRFAKVEDVTRPINWPPVRVVLGDGRPAVAYVLHTSVCPDGWQTATARRKRAARKEAHP
jgi:hypothetical protein